MRVNAKNDMMEKKLDELLKTDLKLSVSEICVSEDLIQRTLAAAAEGKIPRTAYREEDEQDTVSEKGTDRIRFARRFAGAAAVFLVLFAGAAYMNLVLGGANKADNMALEGAQQETAAACTKMESEKEETAGEWENGYTNGNLDAGITNDVKLDTTTEEGLQYCAARIRLADRVVIRNETDGSEMVLSQAETEKLAVFLETEKGERLEETAKIKAEYTIMAAEEEFEVILRFSGLEAAVTVKEAGETRELLWKLENAGNWKELLESFAE